MRQADVSTDADGTRSPHLHSLRLRIETPYLDELGSVYIPAVGEQGDCVKLNEIGSEVWRQIARSGHVEKELAEYPGVSDLIFKLIHRQVVSIGRTV
ncbi:hypothetical protein [Saccharomonospora saliphila]|uniref:hypothetical protein n=1 Tax=Saccharomonospora saliphila TaxID=369829 RepID=UPI00035F1885|nr:hypothetical protein [Saccharomonospora saliphila]